MNTYLLLAAELLISLLASLAVLRVLSRPLVDILGRICPDEQAAIFWLSYTKVMLIIAPLILVLTIDLLTRFSDPMDKLRFALMAALCGLLLGMFSIGKRLGRFVSLPPAAGRTA